MPNLFTCCCTPRAKHTKTNGTNHVVKQNGARTASLTNSPSDTDISHSHNLSHKLTDGSVKETVSLSNTSQAPADAASASLGGWSGNHHLNDGFDVSKVNLVPSEDSFTVMRPLFGASPRPSEVCDDYLERFESLVGRLERIAGVPKNHVDSLGLKAFQSLIDKTLLAYTDLSSELGPEIKLQSSRVREAFILIRDLIKLAQTHSKPVPKLLDEYFKPVSYKLTEISDFDRHHQDPLTRNALIMVADSCLALAWCGCQVASVFVKEICEATNAFVNKTFQYCHSNQTKHAEWIRVWMACMRGLQEVVEQHFPFGLIWNPNGSKPPTPAKAIAPQLYYTYSASSPKQSGERKQKVPPLFAPSTSSRSQYNSHQELLSEISQTRERLRHIEDPDFW